MSVLSYLKTRYIRKLTQEKVAKCQRKRTGNAGYEQNIQNT